MAFHALACRVDPTPSSGSGGATGGAAVMGGGAGNSQSSGGASNTQGSGGAGGYQTNGGAGTGGTSPSSADGNAAGQTAGSGGGAAGASAGTSGSAGAGGSAGGSAPSGSQPTLTILEPFRPAQGPDLHRGLFIFGASDDGSVLAGTSLYQYRDTPLAYVFEAVVWTRPTGLMRIGVPAGTEATDSNSGPMSADGRFVFGDYYRRDASTGSRISAGLFRWSPSAGFITFGEPGSTSGAIHAVSRDGKVAVGVLLGKDNASQWFRWTEGDGLRRLADTPGWREGAFIAAMSSDGKVLLGQSEVTEKVSVLRWTEAGLEDLGLLPGAVSCIPFEMTVDGSVIIGMCTDGPLGRPEPALYDRTFRWSAPSGMVELPVPTSSRMSSDGAVIMAIDSATLYRWTPNDLRIEPLPRPTSETFYSWAGISSDGRVGYGYRVTRLGFGEEGSETEAFRFSESSGFELLGFLPGHIGSTVQGISGDGLVLGGSSWSTPKRGSNFTSDAVVWDARGLRDVAGELSAAGIDFSEIALPDVTRVWSGSPIVVVGTGTKGKSNISWVATLPARP